MMHTTTPWATRLALLLLLLTGGCSSDPAEERAASAGPAPAVVVTEVTQRDVPLYADYVARTEAITSIEIRARVEGVLESAHFDDGARVKKGQLLFVIEQRPYEAALMDAKATVAKAEADLHLAQQQVELIKAQAQLAQARAGLTKAEQDVKRMRPLAAEAAVPEQELDASVAAELVARAEVDAATATVRNTELTAETYIVQAEAALERAKVTVIQAELNLSYTEIRSTIDGQIGRRLVDPGNLVGRGETTLLATVAAQNPINVVFGISETDYLELAKQWVKRDGPRPASKSTTLFELLLADDTKFQHKGRFMSIENEIDPTTGTLTVEAQFPNPQHLLRPGQFARIRFPVALQEDALLVPKRAVLRMQGVDSVYKVSDDNKVALHTIAIEGEFEDFVLVTNGVSVGERIVMDGHQKVRPGMSITPTARTAESGKAGE